MSLEARRDVPAGGLSRRTIAIGAVGAAAMVGLGAVKVAGADPIVRPPGAQDEGAFIASCIHCERCREVCPQHAVKPARLESGLLNLRTPQMDFRSGWCDFCENEDGGPLCAAACPTNAFRLPVGAASENVRLGIALINRDWCLAFQAMGCHECVDACPYEAIELTGEGANPHVSVLADKCNGCGACESVCVSLKAGSIVSGAQERAIVVKPIESAE